MAQREVFHFRIRQLQVILAISFWSYVPLAPCSAFFGSLLFFSVFKGKDLIHTFSQRTVFQTFLTYCQMKFFSLTCWKNIEECVLICKVDSGLVIPLR